MKLHIKNESLHIIFDSPTAMLVALTTEDTYRFQSSSSARQMFEHLDDNLGAELLLRMSDESIANRVELWAREKTNAGYEIDEQAKSSFLTYLMQTKQELA